MSESILDDIDEVSLDKPKLEELISEQSITEFGHAAMTRYATEVNLDRSVPDVYDGCKPVLRRVLQSAYAFRGKPAKSAKIVGHCFAANTKVLLPGNEEINIEDCKIGDIVVTDNGLEVITDLFCIPNQELYRITFEDGTYIDATSDQIFYCIDTSKNEKPVIVTNLKVKDQVKSI